MNPVLPKTAWLCAFFASAILRGQELPAKGGAQEMEKEATKLLNDLPALTDPNEDATDSPDLSVQDAKKRLERSQKKMVRWEKLLSDGVLSKSEVERCTVEVAEGLARYEHALVQDIQKQLASAKERVAGGAADQGLIQGAMDSLKSAQASAQKADEQLLQTKFDLAKINLERQRKLYAMKMGSKAAVEEAQALVQKFSDRKALQQAEAAGDVKKDK